MLRRHGFRIAILTVGQVDREALNGIRNDLSRVFPQSFCYVSADILKVPRSAHNPSREQYLSTKILSELLGYAEKRTDLADTVYRVLGVTEVDLYVPGLNFVFGEAQCPGKVAVISVYRLMPEFYGEPSDGRLFLGRCVKEAVHEIGHTLGVRHCSNPSCVMHFSLHIGMTDGKGAQFCGRCRLLSERAIGESQHS